MLLEYDYLFIYLKKNYTTEKLFSTLNLPVPYDINTFA